MLSPLYTVYTLQHLVPVYNSILKLRFEIRGVVLVHDLNRLIVRLFSYLKHKVIVNKIIYITRFCNNKSNDLLARSVLITCE